MTASMQRFTGDSFIVEHEAEVMLECRPVDSPMVNVLGSHGIMWSLEPSGGVELVGCDIVSRIHSQGTLTRRGFVSFSEKRMGSNIY